MNSQSNILTKVITSALLGVIAYSAIGLTSLDSQARNLDHNGKIGNRVWLDTNQNGLQDDGEPGVTGVKVILEGVDNDEYQEATIVNENGYYEFVHLCEGEYRLKFENLPDGHEFTQPYVNRDWHFDSNANPSTGYTETVRITNDETNHSIDAGLINTTPTPLPAPEPVEPTEPVSPQDPVEPTEPVTPTDPESPQAPVEPAPTVNESVKVNNPVVDPTVVTKVPRTGGAVNVTLSTAVLVLVVGGVSTRKKLKV